MEPAITLNRDDATRVYEALADRRALYDKRYHDALITGRYGQANDWLAARTETDRLLALFIEALEEGGR